MAAKSGYKVSATLVDGVTGPLKALNKRLAEAQAPFARLHAQIDKFKELTGINKLTNGIKAMVGWAGRAVSAIASMIPVIGALTGAATLAGMFKLIGAWANLGTRLLNTTAIVGGSVTQLQQMQNAARLAGSSADDMTASIQGLGQAAQDALSGKNREASALFQAYGVSIRKSGYQAKDGATLMGDAFEIIRKLHDKGASPAVIQQAMGILGLASGMTRFAIQGREGLEKYNKMAEHFGLLSPKAAEQADNMRESFGKLTMAVEGFFNSVSEKVGPVLTPMITQFAEWIAINRDWIAQRIADYVAELGVALGDLSFTDVVDGIGKFEKAIEKLPDKLDKIITATRTLLELWAGKQFLSILAVLGVPAPLRALIAGTGLAFAAEREHGQQEASTSDKAHDLGLTPDAFDEMGHATSYGDGKGKSYYAPQIDDLWNAAHKSGQIGAGRPLPPEIEAEVRRQARAYGLDEDHMARLARQEQGWDRTSSKGATGVMQLMPDTARDLHVNPNDVHQNIEGGTRYFKQMLDLFGGNYGAATAAYNAGPNNLAVQRYARTGHIIGLPEETRKYLLGIMGDKASGGAAPIPSPIEDIKSRLHPDLLKQGASNVTPIGATSLRQQGNLQVTINAPIGWRATARASGNVVQGAPRIVTPMTGIG